MKNIKLGSYIEGVVGASDPSAQYILKASLKELDNTPSQWKSLHDANDVPLYRINNLAFEKNTGLEIPIFTRKEDALSAYNRLLESKQDNKLGDPSFQILSTADLLQLFGTGGFEARSLELYPSMNSVESYQKLNN